MNAEMRVKKWEEIKAKIDLFSQRNPKGKMKEFFEEQPQGTRSAYYSYKPPEYVWPNGRSYNRGTANRHRRDKTHNRYFKRMTGWTYKDVYHYQQTIGLNPDEVPQDWEYMKEKYLRMLVDLKGPVEEQQEKQETEIPMFELPDYSEQPIKPAIQEEPQAKIDSSSEGNRDKLQAIMRVYEQTIQAIKELS